MWTYLSQRGKDFPAKGTETQGIKKVTKECIEIYIIVTLWVLSVGTP